MFLPPFFPQFLTEKNGKEYNLFRASTFLCGGDEERTGDGDSAVQVVISEGLVGVALLAVGPSANMNWAYGVCQGSSCMPSSYRQRMILLSRD